jgi:GNAT superfamily N-acetyltransferase
LQDLHVRPATLADVDVVLDLLGEAAAWMSALGYPNWPERFSRRLVERNARDRELYVATLGADPVAAVTLLWGDAYFWGAEGEDERAGYVHRLVVRRDRAGAGLGAQILDWADAHVRERGRSELRLDVVSDNAPLRQYYERAGFAYVRDLQGEWETKDGSRRAWCTSLYRRPV